MRTICRDVSALSRTIGIPTADLAGTRTACGEIQLYLVHDGAPVAPLTVSISAFGAAPGPECIVVRDYGEHWGLHRTLEAAGIATKVARRRVCGTPVVEMRLAACLLAHLNGAPQIHLVAA